MADTSKDLPKSDKKSGPGATPGKYDPEGGGDKPELGAVGEDPNSTSKNTPPPDKQPNTPNRIDNRDQDPNHPANITPPYRGDASPRPIAEGVHVQPDDMMTTQEREAADSGGKDPNAGVGPVSASRSTTGPVETIEDWGIGPRTPYPTGNPPPSREDKTLTQSIWRGSEDDAPDAPGRQNLPQYQDQPRGQQRQTTRAMSQNPDGTTRMVTQKTRGNRWGAKKAESDKPAPNPF